MVPSSMRRLETTASSSPPASQFPGSPRRAPNATLPANAAPVEDDVLELDPPWIVTFLVCSTVTLPASAPTLR